MTSPTRKRRSRLREERKTRDIEAARTDFGPWEELRRSDCVLIGKAVRKRWDVCKASHHRLVEVIIHAVVQPSDDRLAISAAQVAVAMVDSNQADERRAEIEMRHRQNCCDVDRRR